MTLRDAAADAEALDAFLALPRAVYREDPLYAPPPAAAERASLLRADFAGGQQLLVAVAGERPVARLAARRSPHLRDTGGLPYGLLGFFEALPGERPAVAALFRAGIDFLRAAGCGAIVGPMDGDTWHRYRLNLGPHPPEAEAPFLMEPYNPPHYPELWEEAGFAPLQEYLSVRIDDPALLHDRLASRARLPPGYRLRRLSRRRFARDLDRLHELSREIFAASFLYSPIGRDDFRDLYRGAFWLIDPDLVCFVESPAGESVGFLFALPDRQRALTALRRARGPLGLVAALRRLRTRTLNLKTIGLLPEHRRAGLAFALLAHVYGRALAKGYRAANHCLMRAGNPSERLDLGCGRPLRRYRLYRLGARA